MTRLVGFLETTEAIATNVMHPTGRLFFPSKGGTLKQGNRKKNTERGKEGTNEIKKRVLSHSLAH